ncbi:MAG TPA: FtsW/RodA/SpoVE family cell cycle protein [Gemmatimonadales bacterium]
MGPELVSFLTARLPVRSSARLRKEWLLGWEARLLVLITSVLIVIGLASIYAASSALVERGHAIGSTRMFDQLAGALVGAILLVLASRLNLDRIRDLAWPILLTIGFLLLLLILPFTHRIAPRINGSRRWLDIAGVSVQISELCKLAVVMWTAMLCARKGPEVTHFNKGALPVLVVVVPLAVLIALEPDLSVAMTIVFLAMIVLFAAGARIGHFLLLGLATVPVIWHEIEGAQYRLLRVVTFLDPGSARLSDAYQIDQSLIGVGSGGLHGVGFGNGQQKLGFLPYPYSDFIFATIAEEWGFAGVLFLVACYTVFVMVALRLSKAAADPFRQLLGIGCTVMIGSDAFLHMAVGVGIVPTTGLVLPFVSYGRSGLIVAMIATGLLINLGSRKRQALD